MISQKTMFYLASAWQLIQYVFINNSLYKKVNERLCGGLEIVGLVVNTKVIADIKIFSMKLLYLMS